MLTDFLLGATIVLILLAASLLFAALDDIRQILTRIEQRQHAICDELDVYGPQDEARVIDALD